MKLLRYGEPGAEKPGLLDAEGRIRDLSDHIDDIDATALAPKTMARLAAIDVATLPVVKGEPRIGCPVVPRMLIAIGLNYAMHAKEAGMELPKEPIVFVKTCPATGPNDTIVLPKGAEKGDWEAELCFVMGRKAQYVSEADALNYVAGYAAGNDVSERSWQLERGGSQWTKGKSSDTFAPIGPWLVTPDEVGDPQKLRLWLKLNGKTMQDAKTDDLIFDCAQIISQVSQMMTLHPGDVVFTGTPSGVGLGMKPPVFLKAGDHMTMGLDKLGEHSYDVVAG
jgi:2,4-didehydro-3-deoxy-L-rhamnonate hydrolase